MPTRSAASPPLILLTRPPAESAASARAMAKAGYAVLAMPLQYTRSAPATTALAARVAGARKATAHVLVSRAAVRAALRHWPGLATTSAPLIAVGRGTAAALAAAGLKAEIARGSEDSEGVLAAAALATPAGQRIAIWLAPGGRQHIVEELARRGAEPWPVPVYRRVRLPPRPAALVQLWESAPRVVLSATSGALLSRLDEELAAAGLARLRSRPLLVVSARVAEHARALGFSDIHVAGGADAASLLRALASIGVRPQ
jgi:uroporphyrinogen-III synthase